MRSNIADKARLHHIYEALIEIEKYIKDSQFQDFAENSMMRFACIKQMEIIGEACNHLTQDTKDDSPSIEWKQIIGMRNVFVHEYFGIDYSLVWEIIKNDLPEFKSKIIEIL